MSRLFKKSKSNILIFYVIVYSLVLAGLVYFKKDTDLESIPLIMIFGSIGLSILLWYKQIARFDLKIDQIWPFRVPDKWIIYYELGNLVIGSYLFLMSCIGTLSLLFS